MVSRYDVNDTKVSSTASEHLGKNEDRTILKASGQTACAVMRSAGFVAGIA